MLFSTRFAGGKLAWRRDFAGLHHLFDLARFRFRERVPISEEVDEGTKGLACILLDTFLLRLPEDTKETMELTVQQALELPLDFASFKVAFPNQGTLLRQQARDQG